MNNGVFWTVLAIWVVFSLGNSSDSLLLLRGGELGMSKSSLILHTAAYWLLHTLRRTASRRSVWRGATFDTIRRTFVKIAVRVEELKGKSRRRPLVTARQVGMYVCRELTEMSYPQIARESLSQALDMFLQTEDVSGYALIFDGFAYLAHQDGDLVRALQLAGFAEPRPARGGSSL